ncbi:MAG: hypothetical protein WC156_12125 [Pedobacter sp.]
MGLLDLFSKLVVEHGSAEVQSKHIALFKDQLALADKKSVQLESEVASLKSKLEKAESDFRESQEENEILRGKIKEYEQPTEQPTHDNLLDGTKLDILKLLFKQEKLQIEQIAQTLNLEIQVTKLHLGDLRKMKFVRDSYPRTKYINQVITEWSLSQEGIRYVTE